MLVLLAMLVLFDASDKRLVNFYGFAFATDGAGELTIAQRHTNAVHEKLSGFQADAQHALELASKV